MKRSYPDQILLVHFLTLEMVALMEGSSDARMNDIICLTK